MYIIGYDISAYRNLSRLPMKERDKIIAKLKILCVSPRNAALDIKKLSGRDGYRLRVGNYRVIYTIEDAKLLVWVIDIGHRQSVYE